MARGRGSGNDTLEMAPGPVLVWRRHLRERAPVSRLSIYRAKRNFGKTPEPKGTRTLKQIAAEEKR